MTEICMRNKVCLVTGCSSGIGKVTARELAALDATVVMVCRNRAKGEEALQEVQEATGSDKVELLVADLSSLSEVRCLARSFKQRYTQLHVLIHNAGGANAERRVTPEGYETTFVTNYLAPFLLTELLLDVLKENAPARIVNVSSMAHVRSTIDFADLQGEKCYNLWKAYGQSKLALILFTYELARRLEGSGVTVNALHPGVIASNFDQGLSSVARWGWKLLTPFLASVEQGAQTTLCLAAMPELEGVSGKYFANRKETRSSPISYDREIGQRLWQVSEKLVRTLV